MAALPVAGQQRAETKYGVPVKAGPMDSILLKDYRPESSLVVPRSEIRQARFGVIDVHSHSSMSDARTRAGVDAWVRTMDEVGVERSVVFTDATGAEFDRQAELFLKSYPGRFQVWCGLDTAALDAPDFSERAVRELERCYRMGARGVGELSDKGWGFDGSPDKHRPRDKRLHLDDPRLDLFWRKCGELKIPVNIHVADHPSCWRPLDARQERSPDFQTFNLYGKDVPSFEELMARRDRLLGRHRGTTFILCHLSNQGHDLATAGRVLDSNPNLYLDIAARDYELGRQPRAAARFLEKYKDRILFGTDMGRAKEMYLGWWRLLESPDEYIPGRAGWRHYGLALNEDVLRALYRENALRLLNWQDTA
jgi:predicted TIM-barrel fold metal-dependent hydrolase